MKNSLACSLMLAALALLPSAGRANVRIPPNANTGRPGEVTCANCHIGQSAPQDSSILAGLPAAGYEPGTVYNLTLSVRFAGMKRWGFEITAADSANRPAGRFVITDSVNTQLGNSRGFEYVKQTGPGTHRNLSDTCSWSFDWRAPDSAKGPLTFCWDALPCNNDGGPYGDVDIPGRMVAQPWQTTIAPRRHAWRYPDPNSTRVVITCRGRTDLPFRIFSADGRLVGECRAATTGTDAVAGWQGTDSTGTPVPSGDYFVELGQAVDSVIAIEFVKRLKESDE